MSRAYLSTLILFFCATALFCGCGNITGNDLPYVASPRAVVVTPVSPAGGIVDITFNLIDKEKEAGSVNLEYSLDSGQTYATATLSIPADALNLDSDWYPGCIHTIQWDSVGDNVAISGDAPVVVKVLPFDASNPAGTPGYSGVFTVNNTAYNQAPAISVTTPTTPAVQYGNIPICYTLTDTEEDDCSILVQYSPNSGTDWINASSGSFGDGISGLASSSGGTSHMFLWNSSSDGVATTGQVDTFRIRIIPTDFHEGIASLTTDFSVDNSIVNVPPTVSITTGPAESSTVVATQVAFEWSGADSDGSILGYYYSFDVDPPDTWTNGTSALSGMISEGMHSFSIFAIDNNYDCSTTIVRTFTIALTYPLEITTTSLPVGEVDEYYVAQLQASGGTPPYDWYCVQGNLAAIGLSLDAATGIITGYPLVSALGENSFAFEVYDSDAPAESVQKTLPITIVPAGENLLRDWHDFRILSDDGNYKLIIENDILKLAPEGDVFGSVYEDWSEYSGDEIFDNGFWPEKQAAAISESSGRLTSSDGGASAWAIAARREFSYLDGDVMVKYLDTDSADTTYVGNVNLIMWLDPSNAAGITYDCRKASGQHAVKSWQRINQNYTELSATADIGLQAALWFRIKRECSGATPNLFSFYYATSDPVATPSNWIDLHSGQVRDATFFDENDILYPVVGWYCEASADTYSPDVDFYSQWTTDISAQRFWDDSPECNIIDSNSGTPEYCLNAGSGGTWLLTGFSAILTEPGTSSVLFMAGCGDSSSRGSATWLNGGAWMTAAEVNTRTAAGELNGHRYVFLNAQFNSDSIDQPTLTSIEFEGNKTANYSANHFDTSISNIDNIEMVYVSSGARLSPDEDPFGFVYDMMLWSNVQGNSLYSGGSSAGSMTIAENSGVLSPSGSLSGPWTIGAMREVEYDNADIITEWSSTHAAVAAYSAYMRLQLQRDGTFNSVWIDYRARAASGEFKVRAHKQINGVTTSLFESDNIAIQAKLRLRLRRQASSNTFTFYYSTWSVGTSSWNSWVQMHSEVVEDATHFSTTHLLKPVIVYDMQGTSAESFAPSCDIYKQETDYRYWASSPAVLLTGEDGVEWTFDAGSGLVWRLTDASCSVSEPDTSTVLFLVGVSNTGALSNVTWINTPFRTISEIQANAASGIYDDYRYIHVKAQLNSDGTDQPRVTSFSIKGAKIVP